jgi:integrase
VTWPKLCNSRSTPKWRGMVLRSERPADALRLHQRRNEPCLSAISSSKRVPDPRHCRTRVWCSPLPSARRSIRETYYDISRVLKAAEIPHVRFHDLRHSCATLLLAQGVQARVVQDILGHSAIRVTMDVYSHVMPSMRDDAAKATDSVFGT